MSDMTITVVFSMRRMENLRQPSLEFIFHFFHELSTACFFISVFFTFFLSPDSKDLGDFSSYLAISYQEKEMTNNLSFSSRYKKNS